MGSLSAANASHPHATKSKRMTVPESAPPVRTPLLMSAVLNRNLEFYCTERGISKNSAVLEMISEQLKAKGYEPTRMPRLVYE
jgi:hypothetical protein